VSCSFHKDVEVSLRDYVLTDLAKFSPWFLKPFPSLSRGSEALAGKYVLHFKPGKERRYRVNKHFLCLCSGLQGDFNYLLDHLGSSGYAKKVETENSLWFLLMCVLAFFILTRREATDV